MGKGISVYPNTYAGYDEDGNRVTEPITAADASTEYINPEAVRSAIDNVRNVVDEGFKNIGKAIANISCGQETLSVEDKTMQPIIDEVAEQIAGGDGDVAPLAIQMEESLEVVYETACDVHDDFQKQLNKQAESSCYTTGVVSVRQI